MANTNEIELKLLLDGKETSVTLLNVDKLAEQIHGKTKSIGTEVSNWGNAVTGFKSGLDLVERGLQQISKPLSIAGEFETAKVQLSVLLGSIDAAEERINELSQFAANTPFEFPDIVKANKTLEVFGGAILSTGANLEMIGDVSAGTNQKIDELAIHFGRLYDGIQSGRPVGEALMRLQEIGALTGESRAAIEKSIATNQDSAKTWGIVTDAMSRYGGMMQKQSETLDGLISNTQDQITLLLRDSGDLVLPLAKDILSVLIPAIGDIRENLDVIIPTLRTVAITTAAWTIAVYGAEAAAKAHAVAVALADKITKLFNATLSMNPVVAVAASLTTLVAVLYQVTDGFNIATMAMKSQIDEQRTNIQLRRDSLDEMEKQIKLAKDEAVKNGETTESIKKYDDQLKQLIQTRKELALLEKQLLAQDLSAQYIDNLHTGLESFFSQFSVMNNVIVDESIAQAQLLSGTIEDRINNINMLLENSSTEQRTILLKLKTLLMEIQSVDNTNTDKTEYNNKKKAKTVRDLQDEIKGLRDSLLDLTPEQIKEANQIKKTISEKEKLIKSITDEKTARKQLAEAVKLDDKKNDIKQTFTNKTEVTTFKTNIEGSTDKSSISQQIISEQTNFNQLLDQLMKARTEKEVEETKDLLTVSNQKIDILKDRNEKIIEDEKRLNDKRAEFILDEQNRIETDKFNDELKLLTKQEIDAALIAEEQNYYSLLEQLRTAQTEKEFEDLQQKMQISTQKQNVLKNEQKAIEEHVKQTILSNAQQFDSNKSLGEQMKDLARQTIKRLIAEAVATQIAKAIASIPFPFNLIAAPLAGLAVSAMLEKAIPKFATGEVDIDGKPHSQGGRTINIEGGESIINKKATARNKTLLQMINSGQDFEVMNKKTVDYNKLYSSSLPNAVVNNYNNMNSNFMKGFELLNNTINDQTSRLEAVERRVSLSLSEFDKQYTDYKQSLSDIGG